MLINLDFPNTGRATNTLTSDNTNVSANETVTIGSQVYTFKTALTEDGKHAYEVVIGANADASLGNLIAAINGDTGKGTKYDTATPVNTSVTAGSVSAHAFTVTAKTIGAAANTIATTETSAHLSWGAATLNGGLGGNALKMSLDSTGTIYSNPVDVINIKELIAFLTVHSHAGTSPTLDVKFQMSPDGDNWVDTDSMTQVTTTDSTTFKRITNIFGEKVRAVVTVGGTNPDYSVTLQLSGK